MRTVALALCAAALVCFAGCKRGGSKVLEVGYVSGVQVVLRDRVAAVFEKAGLVKNGDRVEVLDHDRHFVRVRTATGEMGWMEQRFLASEQVFNQLQKLTAENANDPVQAQGVTRNDTNLHVEPGRETEHLYQITAGEKLAILKRGTADKNAPPPSHAPTPSSKPLEKPEEKTPAKQTSDVAPHPLEAPPKPPTFAYEKPVESASEQPSEGPPGATPSAADETHRLREIAGTASGARGLVAGA